jgi:hypothetical protein
MRARVQAHWLQRPACGSLTVVTTATRIVEVGFLWEQLTASVDVRFTAEGQTHHNELASRGMHIPRNELHKYVTYSFKAVRNAVGTEPGIYLVEAFHTEGRPMPDPGSIPKEYFSEVVDYYADLKADPQHEEPRGEDALWFYIGMAGNLKQRFEQHEQRASALMRALKETIAAEDLWMRVSLQRGQSVRYAGETGDTDMSSDLVRVLFEHAAIADYRRENPETPLINIEKMVEAVTTP